MTTAAATATATTTTMTMIDNVVLQSGDDDFITTKSSMPLRVTCYGSRSVQTPEKFLQAARSVGYILARRGHTCVNGGGATGCMGAMNRGAMEGNDNIVGVLHAQFVEEGKDGFEDYGESSSHQKTQSFLFVPVVGNGMCTTAWPKSPANCVSQH
jgi:SLOG cluster4 family